MSNTGVHWMNDYINSVINGNAPDYVYFGLKEGINEVLSSY